MVTTYFKQMLAKKMFCANVSGTFNLPSKCYLGLSTSIPTAAGGYTEPATSGGYARIDLTTNNLLSYNSSTGKIYNTGALTFNEATAGWGTVTHYVIFDSATRGSGNLLAYGALSSSKSIVTGDIPRVAENALQISITDS